MKENNELKLTLQSLNFSEKEAELAKQNRPRIKFYEGTEGLKYVYEDTLTSTESIRAYATVDDMHKALPNYFPEYYKRRANKNISIHKR
jgi:hypothetical protein